MYCPSKLIGCLAIIGILFTAGNSQAGEKITSTSSQVKQPTATTKPIDVGAGDFLVGITESLGSIYTNMQTNPTGEDNVNFSIGGGNQGLGGRLKVTF